MLASVSNSHSTFQGGQAPRQDLPDRNRKGSDLEANAKDKIKHYRKR